MGEIGIVANLCHCSPITGNRAAILGQKVGLEDVLYYGKLPPRSVTARWGHPALNGLVHQLIHQYVWSGR